MNEQEFEEHIRAVVGRYGYEVVSLEMSKGLVLRDTANGEEVEVLSPYFIWLSYLTDYLEKIQRWRRAG